MFRRRSAPGLLRRLHRASIAGRKDASLSFFGEITRRVGQYASRGASVSVEGVSGEGDRSAAIASATAARKRRDRERDRLFVACQAAAPGRPRQRSRSPRRRGRPAERRSSAPSRGACGQCPLLLRARFAGSDNCVDLGARERAGTGRAAPPGGPCRLDTAARGGLGRSADRDRRQPGIPRPARSVRGRSPPEFLSMKSSLTADLQGRGKGATTPAPADIRPACD